MALYAFRSPFLKCFIILIGYDRMHTYTSPTAVDTVLDDREMASALSVLHLLGLNMVLFHQG